MTDLPPDNPNTIDGANPPSPPDQTPLNQPTAQEPAPTPSTSPDRPEAQDPPKVSHLTRWAAIRSSIKKRPATAKTSPPTNK
jgi:hypothetical protein